MSLTEEETVKENEQSLMEGERSDPPDLSLVSMKSSRSMQPPWNLDKGSSTDLRPQKEESNVTSRNQLEPILTGLEHEAFTLLKNELSRFTNLLSLDHQSLFENEVDDDDEDLSSVREGARKITMHVLKKQKRFDIANTLQTRLDYALLRKFKSQMIKKYELINEGLSQYGNSTLLNDIYTEVYITDRWSGNEHEVRQLETMSQRPETKEVPIKCNDIFKDASIRTMLTKGIAGIGKTVSVQKFILDWAEGKANQDFTFMLPLPFRELNLIKHKHISLMKLFHQFFPEIRNLDLIDSDSHKVLLIFDGLDECRLPLNFQNNESLCDVTEPASVDVLLTNLIKGNLLPSAFLWITSRPGAANQIPPECVDQITEVRGFDDDQKEKYFRKRINDQSLANNIIRHMKSSRSLHTMCHIPVFCWISANVLKRMFNEAKSGEIPETLTQMFTHFLIFQIKRLGQKYHQKHDPELQQTRESVLALGKLAFHQLENGNLIFYEEDLRECGIDLTTASLYSGLCTQIFKKEPELHQGKVFSFVHLSVQEFLAALYVFNTFLIQNQMVIGKEHTRSIYVLKKPRISDLMKSAVDKALHSKNGHLDLFLRFLLGLSVESNQNLLLGFMPQAGSKSDSKEETVNYIKKKIREHQTPEKYINLFHCLNEMNDRTLVKEIQTFLNRTCKHAFSGTRLSLSQWSALVFVLLGSKEELNEFDLTKYHPSEEGLLRLLPVVEASDRAQLSMCNLTVESCKLLSSVLSSNNNSLKELDLSVNKLQDAGVKQLAAGLNSSHCKLEILWLCDCNLTEESCAVLSSVLSSNYSSLHELNLSGNKLYDSGVRKLAEGLRHLNCKLKILWMRACELLEESCAALSTVLSLDSCSLRELYLRGNMLKDSGVKLLSEGLQNPNCTLEKLGLVACSITDEGIVALVSALGSNASSQMKELNIYGNKFGNLGLTQLNNLLHDRNSKLKTDLPP